MFKFLRKYNKLILSVGGVLLMITFLIPQAITGLSRTAAERKATFAKVGNNETVSLAEWTQVQTEVHMMEQMGIKIRGLGVIKSPGHWFLLVREATQAGLIGKATLSDDELNAFARGSQVRDAESIREAVSRIQGVSTMIGLFENSASFSDRRMKSFAERMMHTAVAEMVIIPASKDKSDVQPTDAEMQKQMEAYWDKLPGEGAMGFGYKLPNRVKLEWLGVTAESVRALVRASPEFNGVAQRVHWRKYAKPATTMPATTKPVGGKNFPPVVEGGDVPEVVRNDLLDELTRQKLDEIAKYATGQVQRNRMGLSEKDGFVVLPADWDSRKINLTQLAADIQKQYGIELPSYQAAGDKWMTIDEVALLPGIGPSTTDKFGRVVTTTPLLKALKEFGGTGSMPMQKDMVGPPMRNPDGSLYLFRVIAADPARQPTSIDEVRPQLVDDLRKLAHYTKLEASAGELEKKAQTQGLIAVAMENDTVVERRSNVMLCSPQFALNQSKNGQPVHAFPFPLPVLGISRPTTEAIVDRAMALPADVALSTLPPEKTTFVIPVKDKLSLAIVRLVNQYPLTQEMYTQLVQSGGIQSLLASEDQESGKKAEGPTNNFEPIQLAFGMDAMTKRHKYVEHEGQGPSQKSSTPVERDDGL